MLETVLFATAPPHNNRMRFSQSVASALLLAVAGIAQAASSWSFEDASLSIAARKGSEGVREKYAFLEGAID